MKKLFTVLLLIFSLSAILISCDERDSNCDHELAAVPYKEATCQEGGNRAHYKCGKCGKTFADEKGEKLLSADKVYFEKVEHTNEGNGFACRYCGIPYARAYADEISFANVTANTPEQITGGMAMLMGKGVKKIHIYGTLTSEQIKAMADGLSGNGGDLVIIFHDVETVGEEFNGKEALPGYVILKDKIAVHNENGLNYWNTVNKKYSLYLTSDITMTVPEGSGSNWKPVHLETHIYGNGYKIKGLRIVNPEYDDLAGYAAGFCYGMKQDYSTITDLHFVDAYVKATGEGGYAGIISASAWKGAVISGCSVSGEVIGTHQVGGIVGIGSGDIIGCVNNAAVTATENTAGGIVGQSSGNVIGCVNYGTVKCTNTEYGGAGGIVGSATNGSVVGCVNLGSVSVSGANSAAGGVAFMIPSFVEGSTNFWQKNGNVKYGIGDTSSNKEATEIKGSTTFETAVNAVNAKLEEKGITYRLVLTNDSACPVGVKRS